MRSEVELISDGEGLAVIGHTTVVDRFLKAIGVSADGDQTRLAAVLAGGSYLANAGAEVAGCTGRWVKLTEESAQRVKSYGPMPTKTPGISHAMIGKPGKIKNWIQVEELDSFRSIVTSPATLAGAAGIMTQLALQEQMKVITDYLKAIDEKVDHVIRSQTNQVLARLDGVDLAVREAMCVRDAVGRVSEVTWSKVQATAQAIHETEGFALRQLGDLADKLEEKNKINELVDIAQDAEADIQKWLVVLARCVELQDAVSVLELDRVLDAAPEELDRHRLGLTSARRENVRLISEHTERLLERMRSAVRKANSKVLFNPMQSPAVVRSTNLVAAGVHEFHEMIGIESGHHRSDARRWSEAAEERLEQARDAGADALEDLKRIRDQKLDQVLVAGASGLQDLKRLKSQTLEQAGAVRAKGVQALRTKLRGVKSDDLARGASAE